MSHGHWVILKQLRLSQKLCFYQIHLSQSWTTCFQSNNNSCNFPGCERFFSWLSIRFYILKLVTFSYPLCVPFLVYSLVNKLKYVCHFLLLYWCFFSFFICSFVPVTPAWQRIQQNSTVSPDFRWSAVVCFC